MQHAKKLSFVDQMEQELNNYKLNRLREMEEKPQYQYLLEKERNAKEKLMSLDEEQGSIWYPQQVQQQSFGRWNEAKSNEKTGNSKETKQLKQNFYRQSLKRQQNEPKKLNNFRIMNYCSFGATECPVIPQLKNLLVKLNSPKKSKTEKTIIANNTNIIAPERIMVNSKGRLQLKISLKEKQQSIQQSNEKQFGTNDTKNIKSQRERQWERVRDCTPFTVAVTHADMKTVNEFIPQLGQKNKQKQRTLTSQKNNRKKSLNVEFRKKTKQNENIRPISSTKKGYNVNNEYQKIKRQNPSVYQIDKARQRDILNQLIKCRDYRENYHSYASRKKSIGEKFTLANLLK